MSDEMRRNSAFKCEPDIYDEDDNFIRHSFLNTATERQVTHENESQKLWKAKYKKKIRNVE